SRREQRDAGALAWPHGPRALAEDAECARSDAQGRSHPGDVRGRVWPRVEGRAQAHRGRPPHREALAPAQAVTRGIFVCGTDTGAGKTHVAAALVRSLRERGVRVAAMKPIAAGLDEGQYVNAD